MPNRQSPYGDDPTVHTATGRAEHAGRDHNHMIIRAAAIIFASFSPGVGATLL